MNRHRTMNDDMSESDSEIITHVLTYGYPSTDDAVWEQWREAGWDQAPTLARETARLNLTDER